MDECRGKNRVICADKQTCINVPGSYRCSCATPTGHNKPGVCKGNLFKLNVHHYFDDLVSLLVHYNNNNDVCGISQRNCRLLVNLVKGF